jgi:hypothetical protein
MRNLFLLGSLTLLLAGCATSTIESRRQERPAAYAGLSPELKELVDQGLIRTGMPEDAVYIAWGKPAQVLHSQAGEGGPTTTWLYHGGWMEETRYWNYREINYGGKRHLERYLDRDYVPREYVSAEIVFVDGKVHSWRTLPRPIY